MEKNKVPIRKKAVVRYQRFLKWAVKISIVIAITLFFLIAAEGYHRLVSRQIIERSAHLIKPLDSNIDTEALAEIEKKHFFKISQVELVKQATESGETRERE